MTIFPEYESFDGLGLAHLIQKKVITPAELLDAAIERVEQNNPSIHAVIYKMYEQAQASIQKTIPTGVFQGVPFLLKDILTEYEGTPMQCGSRLTQHYISQSDSYLVKLLKKSGLIIFGKTNTPEFGLSPTTEPLAFGPTRNPWDLSRSPGGSSGGAAAAVASHMVPMAHASDGAGSIRIPSAYCGVFGFKPTRGRTPSGPYVMRIWKTMVTDHVITRSVRDSAAMLDVLSEPEIGEPLRCPRPNAGYLDALEKPLRPLRIGLVEHPFFPSTVSKTYLHALKKAGHLCESLGHHVSSTMFPLKSSDVALAFLIMITADTAMTIDMLSKALHIRSPMRSLETLTAAAYQVGSHFSAKEFAWATYILDQTSHQCLEFFQAYDILLTPTMATPPPLLGHFNQFTSLEKWILNGLQHVPFQPLLRRIAKDIAHKHFAFTPFTPLFNITGQPAMSLPLFWDEDHLPIGIQCIGRYAEDQTLLQLAAQLEKAEPWINKYSSLPNKPFSKNPI